MVKWKVTLGILLENEFAGCAVYYPGQVVAGKLRLTTVTQEDLQVERISITLNCHATVRWVEGSGQHSQSFTGREQFLNHCLTLLKGEQGQDTTLPAGTHEFVFQFYLPEKMPSSFEGEIGHVRHKLKAHVQLPRARYKRSQDSRCKRVFTFINPLDLNKLPDVTTPIGNEKQTTLCCWYCKSDPILATMVVKNRRGFMPGETILFTSDITNKSGRTLKKIEGKLIMKVHFHATDKTRVIKKVLTSYVKQGKLRAGSSDTWTDGKLPIPPFAPPSCLEHCKIMDIKYYATLYIEPAGPAQSFKVPVEVTIGSIPLRGFADQYNNANTTTAPPIPTGTANQPSNWPAGPQNVHRPTRPARGRNKIQPTTST